MAPPCQVFHASEVPAKAQQTTKGRRRKLQAGDERIDLSACQLFEMLQYKCHVQRPLTRESPVQCFAVDRLFRKCSDRNGPFTVETTAWEGRGTVTSNQNSQSSVSSKPYQWSGHWFSIDTPPTS